VHKYGKLGIDRPVFFNDIVKKVYILYIYIFFSIQFGLLFRSDGLELFAGTFV